MQKSYIETEVTHAEFLHEIISRIYFFETQDFEKSRMSISKIKNVDLKISRFRKIKNVDFENQD